MPLALLLQRLNAPFFVAARVLSPWLQIVPLEETLVARARSAFLVHWFGTRLPVDGLSLRVHIGNIAALDEQYRATLRSQPSGGGDSSLAVPLAGLSGMLAGMMLSPVGAIGTVIALVRRGGDAVLYGLGAAGAALLLTVGLILAPGATGALSGGALAAGVLGLALGNAIGDQGELGALFGVLAPLARMLNAASALLVQLTGPREAVRNPLLRNILDVADCLAALFAQLVGAVAVVITRVGPALPGVARMLSDLADLGASVLAAIVSAWTAPVGMIGANPTGLFDWLIERSGMVLDRIVSLATGYLARLTKVGLQVFDELQAVVLEELDRVTRAYQFEGAADRLAEMFSDHHTIKVINALRAEIAIINPPKPPMPAAIDVIPKPDRNPGVVDGLLKSLPKLPPVPTFPALPAIPDVKAKRKELGIPVLTPDAILAAGDQLAAAPDRESIKLSDPALAALGAVHGRPSVFLSEKLEVQTKAIVTVLKLKQQPNVNEAIRRVVGRVLAPEQRAQLGPAVAEVLAVMAAPGATTDAAADPFPVLDPTATVAVHPVIRKLRFSAAGATEGEVRRFEALVTTRMRRQTYAVAAATWGR